MSAAGPASGVSTAPRYTVRNARPGDRAAIGSLLHAVAEFDAEERSVALALVDDALCARDDYRVLVVDAGERLAGYACFGPTPMTRGGTFDLYWIATSPEARGTGVGQGQLPGTGNLVAGRQNRDSEAGGHQSGGGRHLLALERIAQWYPGRPQ